MALEVKNSWSYAMHDTLIVPLYHIVHIWTYSNNPQVLFASKIKHIKHFKVESCPEWCFVS
jgi:hypothetical protein